MTRALRKGLLLSSVLLGLLALGSWLEATADPANILAEEGSFTITRLYANAASVSAAAVLALLSSGLPTGGAPGRRAQTLWPPLALVLVCVGELLFALVWFIASDASLPATPMRIGGLLAPLLAVHLLTGRPRLFAPAVVCFVLGALGQLVVHLGPPCQAPATTSGTCEPSEEFLSAAWHPYAFVEYLSVLFLVAAFVLLVWTLIFRPCGSENEPSLPSSDISETS